jgi:adenylosuccinate synthase
MINGVTELIMMKTDVLSGFETLKICTHYSLNGEKIDYLPYDIDPSKVQPIYEEVKGWNSDLTGMRSMDELPTELVQYIEFVEKTLEIPVTYVSVGPDRTQTIVRSKVSA